MCEGLGCDIVWGIERPLTRRSPEPGRHVFGAATLALGAITLAWHNYRDWEQLRYILNAASGPVFLYVVAVAQIFGGGAILYRRTSGTGAVAAGVVNLVFALLCVPRIVSTPQVYDSWGNFFEQFSLATGAALIYARFSSKWAPETVNRMGCISLGICAASFALEQAFYLKATADLVPKWLQPGPMFWATATTAAFALASLAMIANRGALLAVRLLAIMIGSFGLLVWIPILISHPRSHVNWSETAETFAIAGTAWILADLPGAGARIDGRSAANVG